jgi:hypothetical protein
MMVKETLLRFLQEKNKKVSNKKQKNK